MGEGSTEPNNADRTPPEPTEHPTERRVTVGEAAGYLGITAEAVRSRVKRGTLKSTKEGSTVYVLLEGDVSHGRQNTDQTATGYDRAQDQTTPGQDRTDDRAELVNVLRDQVEYLREQLGEEREARRRADMLLARLSEANASMAGQIRELTAPPGPRAEPETVAEDAGEVEDQGERAEAQEDAEGHSNMFERPDEETARRPWWRRIFGDKR